MRIFVPCSIINTTRANVITGQYQFLQREKDDDELQQLPSFPVLSSSSDSDLNLSPGIYKLLITDKQVIYSWIFCKLFYIFRV